MRARRVTDENGEMVPTKENPKGELVSKGQWILQRLDSEGKPVLGANGKPDQWPIKEDKMVKTYNVPADVLKSGDGIAAVDTSAKPVKMIVLDKDTTIETPWGPNERQERRLLANYDYDNATNTPGKDFAIVELIVCRRHLQAYDR